MKVKALDSGGSGGVITHVPLPALETHCFTLGGLLLSCGGQGHKVKEKEKVKAKEMKR